jgi:hypothetical protein
MNGCGNSICSTGRKSRWDGFKNSSTNCVLGLQTKGDKFWVVGGTILTGKHWCEIWERGALEADIRKPAECGRHWLGESIVGHRPQYHVWRIDHWLLSGLFWQWYMFQLVKSIPWGAAKDSTCRSLDPNTLVNLVQLSLTRAFQFCRVKLLESSFCILQRGETIWDNESINEVVRFKFTFVRSASYIAQEDSTRSSILKSSCTRTDWHSARKIILLGIQAW